MIEITCIDETVYYTHKIIGGNELWFRAMNKDMEEVLVSMSSLDIKEIKTI